MEVEDGGDGGNVQDDKKFRKLSEHDQETWSTFQVTTFLSVVLQ